MEVLHNFVIFHDAGNQTQDLMLTNIYFTIKFTPLSLIINIQFGF